MTSNNAKTRFTVIEERAILGTLLAVTAITAMLGIYAMLTHKPTEGGLYVIGFLAAYIGSSLAVAFAILLVMFAWQRHRQPPNRPNTLEEASHG